MLPSVVPLLGEFHLALLHPIVLVTHWLIVIHSGAASAVVGNLLSEIESLFRRSEESEIAARGFGGAIGGAVAGYETSPSSDTPTSID